MSSFMYVAMSEDMPISNVAYGKGEKLDDVVKDGISKWFKEIKNDIKDLKLPKNIKSPMDIISLCPALRDMDFSLIYSHDLYPVINSIDSNIVFAEMGEVTLGEEFPVTLRNIMAKSIRTNEFPRPEQLRTGNYLILVRPLYWEKNYRGIGKSLKALLDHNDDFNLAHVLYAMYELLGRLSVNNGFEKAVRAFDVLRDENTVRAFGIIKKSKSFSFVDLYSSFKPISPYPIRFVSYKLPITQGTILTEYLKRLVAIDDPFAFITENFGIDFPKVTTEVIEQAKSLISEIR